MAKTPRGKCDHCDNPERVLRSGLCNAHALRLKRHGHPLASAPGLSGYGPCSVTGCTIKAFSGHALCLAHKAAVDTSGYLGLPARLADNIAFPDDLTDHWMWTGYTNGVGYGYISWLGKDQPAHRVLFTVTGGTIPEGYDLDHLCRVSMCVNPTHMEPVTPAENRRRGGMRLRCIRGHLMSEAMIVHRSSGKVTRSCQACVRDRAAEKLQGASA